MIKKIFFVFYLFILVSCASINNSSLIEYSGKLLINQNGKEQFSFNIHVAINRSTSIIQIKKPLFGNVLKIIAAKDKDLTFIQSENGQSYAVPDYVNTNFKYWLDRCLLEKVFEADNPEDAFYFSCYKEKNRTNFVIAYEEYELKGFIVSK
jgi:hypothetical protein